MNSRNEYVELHAHSYFSLLDGASSPEALLDRAAALGMPALALTDHDNLYGAVRFWKAARERGIRPIVGAEVTLVDDGRWTADDGGQGTTRNNQHSTDNIQRATASLHHDGRNLTPDTWRLTPDTWRLTPDTWRLTPDTWRRTPDTWRLTPDTWRLTPDTWRRTHHLTLLAETQSGYANLCRLLSQAHLLTQACLGDLTPDTEAPDTEAPDTEAPDTETPDTEAPDTDSWPGKGEPRLSWEALNRHRQGLIALSGCRRGPVAAPILAGDSEKARANAERLLHIFGRHHLFIELQRHLLPDETPLIGGQLDLARKLDLPVVATNNVHYADRTGHRLQQVLTCIRHLTSLDQAGDVLRPNSECFLKAPDEMNRLFAARPDALHNTFAIAERCQVSLDFSAGRMPEFSAPDGHTVFSYLYDLCQQGLHHKYQPVTPAASKQLAYELDVIERSGLAGFFLIVWDIVRFAGEQGIRYQGRGSAANSLVAYLLEITPVDPLRFNLLFDRFLSPDRHTMPDIDIDFAADRREEVIQYVYGRYGAEHTAMVCNINTFRSRSAIRDVARTLGIQPDLVPQLQQAYRDRETQGGSDAETQGEGPYALLMELAGQLQGLPRHISIHNGGMLITAEPLHEIVPLERAKMPGRVVVQWDKDSVEDAGLIKFDLLGLRTLGMVSEIARLVEQQTGRPPALAQLTLDDPKVYDDLCRGDTIGAFQVESRAQMQMLPRLKPRRFEDIVVEVAIIRPGPIQGNMVHPYLRRRQGLEPVTYPHPTLEPVLAETHGVVLFQEQVLRVAMELADFSGGEADQLRRAMKRKDPTESMKQLGQRFVAGAMGKGLSQEEAVEVFGQLAGFASYGFCKSHAAAFALLSYQTMWLKHYHPAPFYCALLNHQPMGFYSPAVVMGDARRHGVAVLPPDLNRSEENCTLEGDSIRLGLRTIKHVGPKAREMLLAARESRPFADLPDLCTRTRLPRELISTLIRAGTLDGLSSDRRQLLWQLGTLDYRPHTLDLSADLDPVALPDLSEPEQMAWQVDLLGMTPGDHPLRLYRSHLTETGILSAAELNRRRDGEVVKVAGQVVIRQRPETAKGHLFLTLEDETGLANLIVRPALYEKRRDILRRASLLTAVGRVQREGRVCSLLVFDVGEVR